MNDLEELQRLAREAILARVRAHDAAGEPGGVYDFLLEVMTGDVEHRRSTLGRHVVAANTAGERRLKEGGVVHLHLVTDLVADDGAVVVPRLAFDFRLPGVLINDFNRLPGLLAQLIAMAFSGWFTNPREKEAWVALLKRTMVIKNAGLNIVYACDQCGRTYRTVRGLMDHLRRSGHVDAILDQYGYWGGEYVHLADGVARPQTRPAPPTVDVDALARGGAPEAPRDGQGPSGDGPWQGALVKSTDVQQPTA